MFSPMALVVGGERGLGPVADASAFPFRGVRKAGSTPHRRVPEFPLSHGGGTVRGRDRPQRAAPALEREEFDVLADGAGRRG